MDKNIWYELLCYNNFKVPAIIEKKIIVYYINILQVY